MESPKAGILVVDDEPAIVSLLAVAFSRAGYLAFGADCAESGLAVFRAHSREIRMVVTDVRLPGMSGVEMADRITASAPDTAVLYMSGTGRRAADSVPGGAAILTKPFSLHALLRVTAQILTQYSPICEKAHA